jgi:hypothetical protein
VYLALIFSSLYNKICLRHDIAEILIKLVLNTNQSTHYLLRAFPGKKYLGGWNSVNKKSTFVEKFYLEMP